MVVSGSTDQVVVVVVVVVSICDLPIANVCSLLLHKFSVSHCVLAAVVHPVYCMASYIILCGHVHQVLHV